MKNRDRLDVLLSGLRECGLAMVEADCEEREGEKHSRMKERVLFLERLVADAGRSLVHFVDEAAGREPVSPRSPQDTKVPQREVVDWRPVREGDPVPSMGKEFLVSVSKGDSIIWKNGLPVVLGRDEKFVIEKREDA